ACWVYDEPAFLCFLNHPMESNLGQSAVFFRITTTYVTMHASKPDLSQILRTSRACRIFRHPPQMVSKECAMLIDRDSMSADLYVGIVGNKGKLQRVIDPPHGTDRVPDPDEPWSALRPGHCILESASEFEVALQSILLLRISPSRSVNGQHHANGIGNKGF